MNRRWKGNINRAILDAAAAFNSLGKVAEEYLTNSLDAFETILHDNSKKQLKRSDCKIQFIIDHSKNRIIFHDEHPLMGMPSEFIFDHFFNIHGKNISRVRYINVRGKHGTGKSAAFGIGAQCLVVDSVYQGKKTTAKSTLKSLNTEDDKPAIIEEINVDQESGSKNGTDIIIELPNAQHLQLRMITLALMHIQRVFGKHLNTYKVDFIEINKKNQKILEERITYQPRESVYEKSYPLPSEFAAIIGNTTLIIKRAAESVENSEEKGILITSNGFAKEQTMFGLDSEPYSSHFFGEWEIPNLDAYQGPNPPSLSTRELILNKDNELVKAIYSFGKMVLRDEIKSFAKNEQIRKQDETLKRLSDMANELANILNDDFSEYEELSKREKGKIGKSSKKDMPDDGAASITPDVGSNILSRFGDKINVKESPIGNLIGPTGEGDFPTGAKGNGTSSTDPTTHAGPLETKYEEVENANKTLLAERRARRKVHMGGGFKIEFASLNHNVFIARVDITTKIITVNIDSEVMKTHLHNCGGNEEDLTFKMFAYSIAIDEYSRAVVNIMAANNEFYGTSMEEILQEGITEMNVIKKRVLDKLSHTFSEQYEEPIKQS